MVPGPRRQRLLYQKIVHAVVMHQRAIESVLYLLFLYFYYNIVYRFNFYSILFLNSFYPLTDMRVKLAARLSSQNAPTRAE